MAQPTGQVLLDTSNTFYGYFYYANGSGMWDARNGAMLTKTGSGAVTATGTSGANVCTSDGTTRYDFPAAITLNTPFTISLRAKQNTAGDAGMVMGNRDGTADRYFWLRSTEVRPFGIVQANTGSTSFSTYTFVRIADGTCRFYKDGTFVVAGAWDGAAVLLSSLMSGYSGDSYALAGSLEFVHIIPGLAASDAQVASLVANPYQALIGGGTTSSITISAPLQYQMFQRSGTTANIAISGSYVGTPTTIEARFNGGAWTTLVASPSGNLFSGTLANCPTGQGSIDVRFSNLTTTTASVATIGVGDIYMVGGQSNNSGRAVEIVAPVASAFTAIEYNNEGAWIPLQESTTPANAFDDGNGNGSYFGALSNLLQSNGVPVAFVPCAVGSTTIANWTRYDADPHNVNWLYGKMWTRAIAVGGHRALIFWQGESDTSTDQATYQAALNLFISDWYSDTGKKTFLIMIDRWIAAADTVRAAQAAVIASNQYVAGWADGNVYSASGNVHYQTAVEINAVANAVYAGIVTAFYTKSAKVRLVDESGNPLPNLTGIKWAWHDAVTPNLYAAPTDKGAAGTTDSNGYITVTINNSTLSSGAIGSLELSTSDGTTTQSPAPRGWAGPVAVS